MRCALRVDGVLGAVKLNEAGWNGFEQVTRKTRRAEVAASVDAVASEWLLKAEATSKPEYIIAEN